MPPLSLAKDLARRGVHLKVQPRPANVYETRCILRALKGYGRVASFRWLAKYSLGPAPNTILAVFQQDESAARLIKESPLQLVVPPRPDIAPLGVSPSNSRSINVQRVTRQTADEINRAPKKSDEDTGGVRTFILEAHYSRFDHQGHIIRQPHYWEYPEDGTPSNRELPARIANKLMAEVDSRKSLRELMNERRNEEPTISKPGKGPGPSEIEKQSRE